METMDFKEIITYQHRLIDCNRCTALGQGVNSRRTGEREGVSGRSLQCLLHFSGNLKLLKIIVSISFFKKSKVKK